MAEDNKRQSFKLERPTLHQGEWHEQGDSVEGYPFQKRHMVEAGFVKGGMEDIASPGEKEANALEVLKSADERDDVELFSVQQVHEDGYGYGQAPKSASKSKSNK